MIKSILVDKRNFFGIRDKIIEELKTCSLCGLDLETQDVNAHEGIKTLRKENAEGDKSAAGKMVFDWHRMVITGLSIYPDNSDSAYYFNLAHADTANRLEWLNVKDLLDAKNPIASFICHNAPFEITVLKTTYNYELSNVIDTMQMAVSAYGPDEYDRDLFIKSDFGDIALLFNEARDVFRVTPLPPVADSSSEEKQERLNPRQQELLNKVIGKTSRASYSYNGLVDKMAYGYGLKKAVMSFFGHKMTTYEEVLGDARHMGELTGEQVVAYGCDDSYWAVQLFFKLYQYMETNCPDTINCFFEQENPMIYIYSKVRCEGMVVNKEAIEARRVLERASFAQKLREIKATIKELLPFPEKLDEKLSKYEKWYATKGHDYRKKLENWANSPDSSDDFTQAIQISSPVSNAWKGKKCDGLSLNHYYQTRVLMYDLCRIPAIVYKGKVMSDSECRGEVRDKIKNNIETYNSEPEVVKFFENADKLIKLLGELSGVEQRMKLYLTPYLLLTDPKTNRMYPELSSLLATRRLAAINPNPMQLAKRGESTYVRGFYLPDKEDHVLLSLDWSQIELVLIGEFSGDPEFASAYSQLPYRDLHIGATADVLSVIIPEVTEDMIKGMHKMSASELPPKLLVKPNGDTLSPGDAKKFWRTTVGKGANFNYWYSGALATVGETMGWTSDQMWKATERYRERYAVAEKWRVDTIEKARWDSFVTLPDGHRRVRYEATYEWENIARKMFGLHRDEAITRFGNEIIRATKTRAGNQLINALIQGSCATLAKRSVLSIIDRIKSEGLDANFKLTIHDELLFSVHKDHVVRFIKMAKEVMCNHPQIIKNLKIDATASIGLTFEPYHAEKAPLGQIELDEAPAFLGFGDGVKLNDEQITSVVDYLFERRAA